MIEQEHIDFCLFGIAVVIAFLVVFLGGKTCCAFDCTPNVDTAIENKILIYYNFYKKNRNNLMPVNPKS